MIELEFNQKVKKYLELSEKVKKLNKIKDPLNLEIKTEIIKRFNGKIEKDEVRVKTQGYRAVLKKRERINVNKGKINDFLRKHKEKVSDFYIKSEYFALHIEKNKGELRKLKEGKLQ